MIVLDTNVISELVRPRPDPNVVAWLEGLAEDAAITAVTLAELMAGLLRLPDGRRRDLLTASVHAAVEPYRATAAVLAFDAHAADQYAEIVVARDLLGRPISTADAQIAAICRARNATCATRNTKDFESTGVELLDPWSA
ncbi:type II toxin-antitoxin system VapC family toxin [Agromyces mangrovi Wang et al. 2018]|uniref:type II toxin-antitoxin system VapC family toxin n=1 Tax=Agromyces mangrovi TaxID=1858653 RepID=UPI0025722BFF|nr:type II toxin-antitoxin system VapC family toxin [Agromyces mangrovi]BDZ63483.1 ribonuclease VapC [Agromyces mangrovi]